MKKILDLSFRYKFPLWGGILIVVTALAVTASLMVGSYNELKEDLYIDSEILGRTLAANLFHAMLQDNTWRAFEIVSIPVKGSNDGGPVKAEMIMVVDNTLRVFVSSQPKAAPILTEIRQLGPDYARVADRIQTMDRRATQVVDVPGSARLYFLTPIADGGARLGTLVMAVPNTVFLPRFVDIALQGCLVGISILAVLLPINWYWGQRMAAPLVQLAARMEETGKKPPHDLAPGVYAYHDELGLLFEAYNQMLNDLMAKEALEAQVVQSERMAALGQLAAGIAHEINNPLSGMLTAIDTLRHHGDVDPRTMKTVSLIERGLNQVKDTVGALLVEARLNSRNLTQQDIEDVFTLIAPQARKKTLRIDWRNNLGAEVAIPATMVRQILLNLLLNAIEAAAEGGELAFKIGLEQDQLHAVVRNDGKMLSPEDISHLFEPFSSLTSSGHGLGLWVTYQIVHQLGGHIVAERETDNHMSFDIHIPLGGKA